MAKDQKHQPAHARQIDWSSAEISDGTLTVELGGAPARGWGKDFNGVLALLSQTGQDWGEVKLAKSKITVAGVQEGSEQALRHFLESVVLQVNADLQLEDDASAEQDQRAGSGQDAQRASEREMAATFRGFAESDALGRD